MVSILISWVLITIVLITFGKLLLQILSSVIKQDTRYNVCDTFFLGLCSFGTFLSIASLFFPLNGLFILTLSITVSICYFTYKVFKGKPQKLLNNLKPVSLFSKILIVLFIIIAILFALLPPLNFDTGLYHLQAMMWAESYPVIPGLANLHGRFGFNSNALLIHSVFSFNDIFPSRVYSLHSLSFIVLFGWIIYKIARSKEFFIQISLVLLCIAFFICYEYSISSPSTDELANILVVYLFLRIILDKDALKKSPLLFAIIPVFCLTLKLSTGLLCIFTLIVLIQLIRTKQYKLFSAILLAGCVIFIPWCVRNVIMTGYLIYPFPAIDIFSYDWKIPAALVENEKTLVTWFARLCGVGQEDPPYPPFAIWSKKWLIQHATMVKSNFVIDVLAIISPLSILLAYKLKYIKNFSAIYPWLVAFAGTLFWAFMAPDERFGFGFIVIAALAPFMLFNIEVKNKIWLKVPQILLLVFFVYSIQKGFKLIEKHRSDRTYISFLYEPQSIEFVKNYASTHGFRSYRLDDIIIYTPILSQRCFDHELPCAVEYTNNIEMRGKSIEDGFRPKMIE